MDEDEATTSSSIHVGRGGAARVVKKTVVTDETLKYEFHPTWKTRKRRRTQRTRSKSTKQGQETSSGIPEEPFNPEPEEEALGKWPHVEGKGVEEILSEVDDLYVSSLVKSGGFAVVHQHHMAFIVQDFNTESKKLLDTFQIVCRRSIKVCRKYQWVYSCSCSPSRGEVVHALDSVSDCEINDALKDYFECQHITTVKVLLKELDEEAEISPEILFEKDICQFDDSDHLYMLPAKEVEIYGVESTSSTVCVTTYVFGERASYHLVVVDFSSESPKLKCTGYTCRSKPLACQHVKAITDSDSSTSDVCESLLHILNSKTEWRSRYIPAAVSEQRVPFSFDSAENSRMQIFFHTLCMSENPKLVPSSTGTCDCGSPWSSDASLELKNLFLEKDVLCVQVGTLDCADVACLNKKYYDGKDDHVLNMGSYLVGHSVMRTYMKQFLTEGTPMIAFYKEWFWQQLEKGNRHFEKMSYYRFRYAWYAFVSILDIEYEEGFECPKCGKSPNIVIMDGVSLGTKKVHMPAKKFTCDGCLQALDGSHNTRVFINNQKTRKLLKKYATSELDNIELRELTDGIAQYQSSMRGLLQEFMGEEPYCNKCPAMFSKFLTVLSSSYPVCAALHYDVQLFKLIGEIAQGKDYTHNSADLILLAEQFPVLSELLRQLKTLPSTLKPVLEALVSKAKYPFCDLDGKEEKKSHHLNPLLHTSDTCGRCPRNLGVFPKLPVICHRGQYILDQKTSPSQEKCTKKGSSHPSLIPGLFTVSCEHGVCYGFHLMEDVESPNMPFTIMRTRFETAPRLIIYDNACNLHRYCLNRDPVFFRDSWFLVDRFHWFNHSGCHAGYNMSSYPKLKLINSQVAEQRNSTLKKLKTMLSYMNLENFIAHCRLFVWFRTMVSLSAKNINFTRHAELFSNLKKVYSTS